MTGANYIADAKAVQAWIAEHERPKPPNAVVQASGAPTLNQGTAACSASPATESIDVAPMLIRLKYRLLEFYRAGEQINRRVKVEQFLFDCAAGKHPLPNAEKCRELALFLGTPAYVTKK